MNLTKQPSRSVGNASTQFRGFTLLIALSLFAASAVFVVKVFANDDDFTLESAGYVGAVIPNDFRSVAVAAKPSGQECTESADLRVLLSRDLTTIAFPRIPLTVSGSKSAMIITRCPNGRLEKPLPTFAWKLEPPPGSTSRLQNVTTLNVTFTPDRPGRYVVKLIGCPNVCKPRLLTGRTPTNKPIVEPVDTGPVERVLNIDVDAEAQMPPLYVPANLPSIAPATSPGNYAEPRSHCGGTIGIARVLVGDVWMDADRGAHFRPQLLDAPRLFRLGSVPPFEDDERSRQPGGFRPGNDLFQIVAELLVGEVAV